MRPPDFSFTSSTNRASPIPTVPVAARFVEVRKVYTELSFRGAPNRETPVTRRQKTVKNFFMSFFLLAAKAPH
jgi:hypothetical protein